jgi:hypothetical protein
MRARSGLPKSFIDANHLAGIMQRIPGLPFLHDGMRHMQVSSSQLIMSSRSRYSKIVHQVRGSAIETLKSIQHPQIMFRVLTSKMSIPKAFKDLILFKAFLADLLIHLGSSDVHLLNGSEWLSSGFRKEQWGGKCKSDDPTSKAGATTQRQLAMQGKQG